MKEVKEPITISATDKKTVYYTTYICETCKTSYQNKKLIEQCPICGKDVCVACERGYHLLGEDLVTINDWPISLMLQDNCESGKYILVCEDCVNKLREGSKSYLEEAQAIVDKFNQDIARLTERFIKNIRR